MRILFSLYIYIGLIIFPSATHASISLSSTRVIYEKNQKEASINVINNGNQETLIQSWLERDSNNNSPLPFAVTPPLAKIKNNQQQLLRILYQGSGLPQDKESVFWLNVQEIPQQAEGENKLQLALRQRIKLFYRPAGLSGSAALAPTNLTIKAINNRLELYNPTSYYINMLSFRQSGRDLKGEMIAPRASLTIEAQGVNTAGEFDITVVNDFGGVSTFSGNFLNGLSSGLKVHKQPNI
ncbi:molecular chaperone [Aeromonas veronii]|uniref:fimbrial biogenesis chaperone n=1 Tax=Aeromonas veronii TaxID=654 RepID=UPI00226C7761|nr:molecular chaperone [Aeromonas veronii]MCX9114731.1 molecular chaperone [Aeromonas veronii]